MGSSRIFPLLLAAAVVAACSAGAPSRDAAREEGGAAASASPRDMGKNEAQRDRDGEAEKATAPGPDAPAASSGGPTPADGATDAGDVPGSADVARGMARIGDAGSDAEKNGNTPSYTEIVAASVVGQGATVRIQTRFAAPLPARMPDGNTFMVVGTRIKKEDRDVYIYVEGDEEGWQPFVARRSGGRPAPGSLRVEGNDVTLILPWRALGGPQPFAWYAQSSWTYAGTLSTDYAFDTAPNGGHARYPR